MSQYDQSPTDEGKLLTEDNQILDLQEFMESGVIVAEAVSTPTPVTPIGEATLPNYEQITPQAKKFINALNEVYDLLAFLKSGNLKIQVAGGVAPSGINYVTLTDATNVLPESFPLSDLEAGFLTTDGGGSLVNRILEETTNQINISNRTGLIGNPKFSLSETLVLPGTLTLGGDLKLATYKITSASGTSIQLVPDNDSDGIDLSSSIVRIDADLRHAGEPDNKFTFTTAAQTHYIGGSSIYDINASGFRLGMGYRVSTISNDAAAFLDTELMTAYAIQTLVGNAIIGSNNFRGGWDASGGLFPTTGGTGPAGAVAAGNNWRISVAGTLGGEPVDQGDQIIAATAVPGQTAANWIIVNPRVFSVFGRTGSVVAESGDYSYGQITGLPATATSGKLMRGNGSAWAETTATYPDTATDAGKILRADGANWVASTPTFPNTGTSGKLIRGDGTNYVETTAQYPATAGTSGTILRSDGTNIVNSTPTFPNTAASGKIMRGDGANWLESTAQYPAAAGTAGNILTSDGTNWISSGPQKALMMMAPTNQSGIAFNFSLSYQEIRGMWVAFTLINGTSNFDMPLEGRLRYIGADPITLWFGFSVLVPSADWSFALYKNATTQLVAVNMTGMSPGIANYKIDLVQNDYISIFGKRFAGTGNAAMYNIQLFCSS